MEATLTRKPKGKDQTRMPKLQIIPSEILEHQIYKQLHSEAKQIVDFEVQCVVANFIDARERQSSTSEELKNNWEQYLKRSIPQLLQNALDAQHSVEKQPEYNELEEEAKVRCLGIVFNKLQQIDSNEQITEEVKRDFKINLLSMIMRYLKDIVNTPITYSK